MLFTYIKIIDQKWHQLKTVFRGDKAKKFINGVHFLYRSVKGFGLIFARKRKLVKKALFFK